MSSGTAADWKYIVEAKNQCLITNVRLKQMPKLNKCLCYNVQPASANPDVVGNLRDEILKGKVN
jgi:hypothetical protein